MEWKDALADRTLPLPQLMKHVRAGEVALADDEERKIGVSSSITVDLLGLHLRREALLTGKRATILAGDFDNPIEDMERFGGEGVEYVFLLPFFDTVLPAFEARAATLGGEALAATEANLRARYRLTLERARKFKSVQLGLFHRIGMPAVVNGHDAASALVERFNLALREEARSFPNVSLIDMEAIVAEIGRRAAFDQRFYFRARAPYSAPFLAELARRIGIGTRGFGSWFYKAVALDCDNTLWGGIIGEDLIEGIALGPFDTPGNIFWTVQQMLSALECAGILLCLCTKNNPDDLDEVLRSHPHMVLRDEQFVAKRVNWQDKVTNLQELAAELNIGLGSIIFLDDNPVEAESVRSRLPMVTVFDVPQALPQYPALVARIAELCLGGGVVQGNQSKTEQYRVRAAAADTQAAFGSHEEYLASLELRVNVHVDRELEAPRVSELTLKSNQFNLTTLRLSEGEVLDRMATADREVLTLTVASKFGNSGLTGIIFLEFRDGAVIVENFLLSCRVLGQGVEFTVWETVRERALARGCTRIEAAFLPTAKNAQVRHFFDRLGLELVHDGPEIRRYRRALEAFFPPPADWIKVSHD